MAHLSFLRCQVVTSHAPPSSGIERKHSAIWPVVKNGEERLPQDNLLFVLVVFFDSGVLSINPQSRLGEGDEAGADKTA